MGEVSLRVREDSQVAEVQEVWVVPIAWLLVPQEFVFIEELFHPLEITLCAMNLGSLHYL